MAPVTRSQAPGGKNRGIKNEAIIDGLTRATNKVSKQRRRKRSLSPAMALLYPEPPVVRHPLLRFGLIQELLSHDLFSLLVQTILWNQTRGTQARPVLFRLLTEFPDPKALAAAPLNYLTDMLYPIGLHNIRATRLIAFAQAWLARPPGKERRYRKMNYPTKGCGRDIKPDEVLSEDDPREGWEVAHLPGMGAYALDTFRIFARDRLRDLESKDGILKDGREPEWKSVVPLDKDLRRYMIWRWEREGYEYDILTGKRREIRASMRNTIQR